MPVRIKLLIAIPNLYGGTGTFCRNLVSGLKKYYPEKYDISILLLDDTNLKEDDKYLADKLLMMDSPAYKDYRRLYRFFSHLYQIRNKIKDIRPDIILSVGTYFNVITSLSFDKKKLLLSEHDTRTERLKYSPYRYLISWLIKNIYRDKKVIGVSKAVVEDLINNFNINNSQLIYYGVDCDEINRLSDVEIKDHADYKPYLISVGRLTLQKDHETLIKAFSIAVKNGIKENLVIIGDGEDRKKLETLINECDLSKRVILLGYIDNPYPYMKNASLFVLSSLWEGFPYVLLEAFSLGVPILSTNCVSGPSEMLGNNEYGILTVLRNPYKMAQEITDILLNSNNLKKFSDKSRMRGKEFTSEIMTKNYQRAFEDIISV